MSKTDSKQEFDVFISMVDGECERVVLSKDESEALISLIGNDETVVYESGDMIKVINLKYVTSARVRLMDNEEAQ